jgi:hypothetical protein
MQQPPTIPLDAQGLMSLILPRIIQFLKDVTPLERMRRINGVLEALSGR